MHLGLDVSSLEAWRAVGTSLGVSVGSKSSQLWCVRSWGSAESSLLVPFLKLIRAVRDSDGVWCLDSPVGSSCEC